MADEFVIGAFIRVLEPAPPADVVDKDGLKIGLLVFNVINQAL